jgi:prephenate dehydrogenase
MKNPKIHIIGGTGKMGQWLKKFFESNKLTVTVSGKDYLSKKNFISNADIIIISSPISKTAKVIENVAPF